MSNVRGLTALLAVLAIGGLSSACTRNGPAANQSTAFGPAASAPAAGHSLPAADAVPTTNAMRTVRIPVEGMSCVACAARVKKTLKAISGVDEVEVHLGERNVRVRFDAQRLTPGALVAAITELGYSAGTPVPAQR